MNNSRRDFLKKLPLAMSIPFTLGGISLRAMGDNSLTRMARASGLDNPRVLVILQMHGGNDGLNNLIPVTDYDLYYSRRPNIAIPSKNKVRGYIPLDSTLPSAAQVGLHPDMQAMKALYDIGRMTVVQGVSYKNNDGSHFRGRDISFMGGAADEYLQSGWVGRYLQGEYPTGNPAPNDFYGYPEDFLNPAVPENLMIDPLALEMGSDLSLIFHQEGNIPTSIGIGDPESFKNLVDGLEGLKEQETVDPFGIPPDYLVDSPYYKELKWLISLEDKTKDYSDRLYEVWLKGKPAKSAYPETYPFNAPQGSLHNPLSEQLELVARLLNGGCKTKVFLVKVGGFDTHVDQVVGTDPTMGSHAALLYHISTAMKAFQDDLREKGIEDNVLTVTTSEFGRRVHSNGSYGTDHGTGGPLYIFGKGVQPGVVGSVPDLTQNNVGQQYDYRVVYANIMKDWMLNDLDDTTASARLNYIFPNTDLSTDTNKVGIMSPEGTSDGVVFETLPLAQQVITSSEGFTSNRFSLGDCYPNPAKEKTTFVFNMNSSYEVNINLFDNQGRKSKTIAHGVYEPGEHKVEVDLNGMQTGTYIYEMKTGFYKESKKLIIVK